eukprot:g44930.t1
MNTYSLLPRDGELKTRGHRFKVRGERFKKDLRGNVFLQRVLRIWNGLPEKVVEAASDNGEATALCCYRSTINPEMQVTSGYLGSNCVMADADLEQHTGSSPGGMRGEKSLEQRKGTESQNSTGKQSRGSARRNGSRNSMRKKSWSSARRNGSRNMRGERVPEQHKDVAIYLLLMLFVMQVVLF